MAMNRRKRGHKKYKQCFLPSGTRGLPSASGPF